MLQTDGDVEREELTPAQAEVSRIMSICNACRYCEGLCAVYPAMEQRTVFAAGDVDYLANLCHGCGACYYDCQFQPPHEFNVNAPLSLATLRDESYTRYAWPGALAPLFERNGLWVAVASAVSVAGFIFGFAAWSDPGVLFSAQTGEGAFYRIMPHNAMVILFGGVFLYALVALAMGVRAFWTAGGPIDRLTWGDLWRATREAGSLRYLDGGGGGCMNESGTPDDNRRIYHHLTFYGFGLCFASTSLGTIMHYVADWQAPYPLWHPVVILGTLGGIGLLVGPWGLWQAKRMRAAELGGGEARGMDMAFLAMLFATAATGLILLVLRDTAAMNSLLAVHLGVVFALFLSFPYGKFVHGIYRYTALVRYAAEMRRSG